MSTETINQQIPAGTWTVDPVHSGLHFAITHNGIATFRSGFKQYAATVTGGEAPQLEGTVEVASIDISEEMLKGHLLSPDFFDAEKHPAAQVHAPPRSASPTTARSASPASSRSAARPRRSRPAAASASLGADLGGSERIGFSLETAVDRREFGLNWNADLPSGGQALEYEVDDQRRARVRRGGRVTMRVLGISGSLRRDSYNSALLRAAAERLPAGAELVEYERSGEIPPYDADLEEEATPAAVAELRAAMREADAVLVATPEYNHSIPGQLKNALDWVSRPAGQSALSGKPAAVIGASTGMFGAVWAQAETRKVLGALGGRVVERELPVARANEHYADGRIELAPEQSEQLEEILAELVSEVEELAGVERAGRGLALRPSR